MGRAETIRYKQMLYKKKINNLGNVDPHEKQGENQPNSITAFGS